MATLLKPDICVIGGGSGGLSVAAAAAAFGVSVVLIEKGPMGGDCLNFGCVPSKAMIAAGKHAHQARGGVGFGVDQQPPDINFAKVMDHVEQVIASIAPHDSVGRFTELDVKVIEAEASFRDARTVMAGDYEIRARRFVIATGSAPAIPPIPGIDAVPHLTNETIFERRENPPKHLLVIGAGPVGLELAQAHCRLGARVTVIEANAALAREDTEAAAFVLDRLRGEGLDILEHTKIVRVERQGASGVRLHLADAGETRTLDGTHLLIAAGRQPRFDGLALEKAGVAHNSRGIQVSDSLRTTNRRVYAIGDAAGGMQFTHLANHHAGLVIRQLLFRLPINAGKAIIPRVTYTDPELAQIGLTESEARESQRRVTVLRSAYADNDRARTERKTDGFIKIVAGRSGRILGVTIAGEGAAEMMNFWSLALSRRMRLRDIASYVAPYPTIGEIGRRAAISSFAPAARQPAVRGLIRFLRLFG